ncbi:hypothetical protein Q0590_09875 [Rhodocytophaga aerolata]|uniref:DUF4350 domain-containing protein n=1 Tax=Rhodocytophaga aerolata TaxID=455078 RepID=A0ABT8R5K3_9BACT|nr:hypothetical protein [Rhodocytophaga aerolata]MDO1446558.1 hypothetical protein [Rhodocytophaga aerolata]
MLSACQSIQRPDNRFDVSVSNPTYTTSHPKVLYDEGHLNTHKADGTYKPFIKLLTHDGYQVSVSEQAFTRELLEPYQLVIITNAKVSPDKLKNESAFTPEECTVVQAWVKQGGALLLIADHHPFGLANQRLANCFGITMGGGSVKDTAAYKRKQGQLEFSHANGLLAPHPIIHGLSGQHQINRVITFTGQSLTGSGEAKPILLLGTTTREVRPDSVWQQGDKHFITYSKPIPVHNLSQAMSVEYGEGRVVVVGEAGVLSAQKLFGRKFGMNRPKNTDNKQFALNIVHWLTSPY